MKGIETDVVYSIPTWAACYLYYGDKDGLSEELDGSVFKIWYPLEMSLEEE